MQMGLDGLGVLDPTPLTDMVNGLVYLLRGKPEEAAVSFAGIIPFVGDAAKLGKRLKRGADAAEELRPVVIGEGMGRVTKYANQHGYKTINDFVSEAAWKRANDLGGEEAMKALNREWIQRMTGQQRLIIDIGPNFERRRRWFAAGKSPASSFYELERAFLKGYIYHKKVFTRHGKWWGGLPYEF
jgi:hypothetical protein